MSKIFILFFLLFWVNVSIADLINNEPCPFANSEKVEELKERGKCLENQRSELIESLNLLLTTQRIQENKLKELTKKLEYQLYGPPKGLELVPAVKLAVTIGYWAKGKRHTVFNCVPKLAEKANKTLIGGQLTKERKSHPWRPEWDMLSNQRGCHSHEYCDSKDEFCRHQSREAGCYVNTAWYTWYVEGQKRKNLPISHSAICAG